MAVDVITTIEIAAPRAAVAAYVSDPDNAPEWYVNIRSAEWKTDPGVAVGARVDFVAHFLGRRLAYTYEITEHIPGERMVMRTSEGLFPMETQYMWEDAPDGGTQMTLRNHGVATGLAGIAAPLMRAAMEKANRKDLLLLKTILEGGGAE